jgi:hyperosmotically inducible protein
MRSLLAACAVVAMMSATPAFAGDSPNEQIFRAVEREVLKYPFFTIFDSVHATVHDGVVELTGKVTMPYKPGGIERRVVKVPGVTQVINRIEVLPVSPFDDSLRVGIARALYGSPHFVGYGLGANPPIHVIVEHGRVTLEGVVNNDVDRRIAQSIVSTFGAFRITSELKTVAEARAELETL